MKKEIVICEICGKPVYPSVEREDPRFWPKASYYSINASVVGEAIELKGHMTCIKNVDDKVVIPSRIALYCYIHQAMNTKKEGG